MTHLPPVQIQKVSGSEAGLSGAEQVRIALDTIVKNGGIADMSQIYEAVENKIISLDAQKRLSTQGKASLRFFINKVGVDAGYIYKHDSRSSGWRITPKGKEYVNVFSLGGQQHAKMPTLIGDDFQFALLDVYILLDADRQISQSSNLILEAFIRSGIILTVTAWETFIEDTIKAHFKKRIDRASNVDEVINTFNSVATAWVDSFGDKRIKSPDIMKWTGDGWKIILKNHFESEIANFNTPKSENIAHIFKRYLGYNIKSIWKWNGITTDQACQQLDDLVSIRGALVHRGRTNSGVTPTIDRKQLIDMMTLVEQLVWATEIELNTKL